jgi:membrane protease subunit HflK
MRNAVFQQIAQRAIVDQVGHTKLDDALRGGRAELERNILTAFQKGLDVPDPADPSGTRHINLGVTVQSVTLSVAQVPDMVKPTYEGLIRTIAEAQSAVAASEAEANAMTLRAEGEKSTLITQAQADKQMAIQTANGDAERFRLVRDQFYKAPDVTRWNLYVDAVRSVTSAAKRIYFANPGQRTVIILDPPQYDAGQVQPKTGG